MFLCWVFKSPKNININITITITINISISISISININININNIHGVAGLNRRATCSSSRSLARCSARSLRSSAADSSPASSRAASSFASSPRSSRRRWRACGGVPGPSAQHARTANPGNTLSQGCFSPSSLQGAGWTSQTLYEDEQPQELPYNQPAPQGLHA